jgi:predicted DCC family thiol-disulfide oxidoreductase YuxK
MERETDEAVIRSSTSRRPDRIGDVLLVYVDADCGLCTHVATWLGRMDVLGRLRLVSLQDTPLGPDVPPRESLLETMHVRDATGAWWTGASACLQIARRVPLLWTTALLGRIPTVAGLMERAYARIARDRRSISLRLGLAECRSGGD